MAETIVKTGQTVPLKIKRLGINGEGIGYFKRLIIFVPYALPKRRSTSENHESNPSLCRRRINKSQKNKQRSRSGTMSCLL